MAKANQSCRNCANYYNVTKETLGYCKIKSNQARVHPDLMDPWCQGDSFMPRPKKPKKPSTLTMDESIKSHLAQATMHLHEARDLFKVKGDNFKAGAVNAAWSLVIGMTLDSAKR